MTARIKAEKNLPNRKKSSLNTAPTLSIHSTSAARNFRCTKDFQSLRLEFCSVCENVCANENRVEFIPTMPSVAKLGQFIANFPHREIMPYTSSVVL